MAKGKGPIFPNRNTALWIGFAAYAVGTLALWDAYEHRGKGRPFAMRFVSGGV